MKTHTQTYKENLITLGKEIDAKITYTLNNVETELTGEDLSSITPHYEGDILKSVMKQVDIVSNIDIPLNTEINVQIGLRYNTENYEYIDYGNYVIYSSEKQVDTNNYKIIAYDKMLYAMKDYEQLFGTNLYNGQLEQGSIAGADGVPFDSTTRVRNIDYLEVEPSTTYTIDFDNTNMDFIGFKYQEDETYISKIYEGWITSKPYTFTTDSNATKLKLLFRYKNDETIEPEDVQNIILKKGTQNTVIYPVTVKQYIEKICDKISLNFANSSDTFANYDKEILNELYVNLGYTYRDVLDELAQVTASTICINSNDELEVRYINNTNETIDEDFIKNTKASFGEKYGPINSIVLSRSADSDSIYIQDNESIEENGLCELKISDNQIMNSDNRNEYLEDLLDYLGGIEYYINDFESIGITYLDLCDRYNVIINNQVYSCVMFNDEVDIRDGLNEIVYTNKPKETQTDYKKATTTDKLKKQTSLIVDKQNEKIEAVVGDVESDFSSIRIDINGIKSEVQGYDTTINELGEEIQTLRASYTEQTPTMISDWFDTNLKPIVDDLQNTASGNDEEIRKIKAYVRRGVITDAQSPYYNQAYIELGDETNQTTLRILQNRIQFLTNGQETAFISNNQLYISESTILTKEKVGHWVTTEDEDGLLNTYWED